MVDKIKAFMEKLPLSVKVGPHQVGITLVEDLEANGGPAWGVYDTSTFSIALHKTQHTTKVLVVETVLHEIMHAIWHHRALSKRPKEEKAVAGLSLGLTQVLQDNPTLFAWIKEGLRA